MSRRWGWSLRVIVLWLTVLAAACESGEPAPPSGSGSSPTSGTTSPSASPPPVPSEAVRFRAEDGLEIDGTVFGAGDVAVLLAHQSDQDQSNWFFFAEELARRGYTAMTFTFRGYCPGGDGGCSEDGSAGSDGWMDVAGAVRLLRERGHERVYLTGASLGGAAVLRAAAERVPAAGVVSLSGVPLEPSGIAPGSLAGVRMPVLLVVGRFDGSLAQEVRRVYRNLPPPTELDILPTGEHGTDLLEFTDDGLQERVRGLLFGFYGEP
ncbi:MAG: alpha/beta hydrolase family protein [Actinomycetota bacterium]